VNFRAVRLSLAKQIVGEALAAKSGAEAVAGPETQVLANTVAVAADPLLEQVVTPEGVFRLLEELNPETIRPPQDGPSIRFDARALEAAFDTVRNATWRGFRNVAFQLPPRANEGPQVRVQFRLSRMNWRVVSIDLPADARQRLLARLSRRSGAPRPN
jgi:hypothetical protein